MLEKKDSAIKLFGRTIQLGCSNSYGDDTMIAARIQASAAADCTTSHGNLFYCKQPKTSQNEICSTGEPSDNQDEESSSISILEQSKTTSTTQSTTSNDKNSTKNHKDPVHKEDESDETSTTQEPLKKKPEEILPCPRCNSMDTKFCYFNNYNVNQPRHFCKNCQRYWTAGGSMRTVPVGSGRRKTKTKTKTNSNSSSSSIPGLAMPMPIRRVLDSESNSSTSLNVNGFMRPQMACFAWNPIPWISPPQWICSTTPWNLHLLPNYPVDPNSPHLGKHSRDADEPQKEKLVPKTLRISDDPIEVAASSVCGGLARNKDKAARCSNTGGGGIFGGFHQDNKGVVDCLSYNVCPRDCDDVVNQANPAAFSRSLLFHEIG